MISEEVLRRERKTIDITLFTAIAFLISFGMAALYSSTFYSKSAFFTTQAILTLSIGTIALFIGMAFKTDYWRVITRPLFVITILLLILVLIKGTTINHAKRWLKIWHFKVQISELAKASIILFLADLLDEWEDSLKGLKTFIKLTIIAALTSLLVAIEPSISAAFVIFATAFAMIFFAGTRVRYVIATIVLGGAIFALLVFSYPHAKNRILGKMGKGQNSELYQVEQAKIAIANGHVLGKGPGKGLAKYNYLPEISNDFIYALIAEEFGLIGSVGIILLFIVITVQGFRIAKRHILSTYKSSLAVGITFLLSLEAALHVGINTGVIPPTGVVLPFVSYGKLAILVHMFLAGVLLRLSYEIEEGIEL